MAVDELKSPVADFFKGAHILITGGTGFMGRVLIEKLLRSCPGIQRIYLIIRIKKGKEPADRLAQLLKDDVFGVLRSVDPDFDSRLTLIPGDCGAPGLGIAEEHRVLLTENVTHVFHSAATVRFDEKIRRAFSVNIKGVQEILTLCKECKRLQVLVHVSTAFAHCPNRRIEERFYKPPIDGDKALEILEIFSDRQLEVITPSLIDPWPNTYSFSKCIAEDLIKKQAGDLPVAIVRPSIVVGCNKEPIPGWIDNVYGPTGVSAAVGVGLMRILCADPAIKAAMVPVDMSINAIICAAWETASKYQAAIKTIPPSVHSDQESVTRQEREVPIYNFVPSEDNILRWQEFKTYNMRNNWRIATVKAIWVCICILQPNYKLFKIQAFFLHIIPAFFMDAFLVLSGNQPKMIDAYGKIHKFCDVIAYFATQEWTFGEENMLKLWDNLTPKDREIFDFDMKKVEWGPFFDRNLEAMRTYIMGDNPSTVERGLRRMHILNVANYILCGSILGLIAWLLLPVFYWALSCIGFVPSDNILQQNHFT